MSFINKHLALFVMAAVSRTLVAVTAPRATQAGDHCRASSGVTQTSNSPLSCTNGASQERDDNDAPSVGAMYAEKAFIQVFLSPDSPSQGGASGLVESQEVYLQRIPLVRPLHLRFQICTAAMANTRDSHTPSWVVI